MESINRFSNRVENYIKYRPHYPQEVIDSLVHEYGFQPHSVIADIGSGTGIFSELLLNNGFTVIGVEPNEAMRTASVELLGDKAGFKAVAGSAAETNLADHSVDFIVCAQAFHWFKDAAVKKEFKRILRAGGKVVVLWNEPQEETAFEQQYAALIQQHKSDPEMVQHALVDYESLRSFFAPKVCIFNSFPNQQQLDYNGLLGRLLSLSYMPNYAEPGFSVLEDAVKALFAEFQVDGFVELHYAVKTYVTSV